MPLRASLLFLLALAASSTAWADDAEPEPPLKTTQYKSHQAVFDAWMAATLKQDHATTIDCIAPSAHKDLAAMLALNVLAIKKNRDKLGFDDKQFKPVFAALEKHGLTEKATKDIKIEDPKEAVKALAKLIKKPTAFATEVTKAQYEMMKGFGVTNDLIKQMKYELKDVKVKGDKASGTMAMTFMGNEIKQPIEFVKVRGGWKILPDLKAMPQFGGGAPAVAPPVVEKVLPD